MIESTVYSENPVQLARRWVNEKATRIHLVDLDLIQQLTIVLTATLASIGASAVPSAGLIMMIMVLRSVGLPPFWIAIIFPIDRILDMCRTVVNVTGDAAVATVMAEQEN